jgi:hypothetical protein
MYSLGAVSLVKLDTYKLRLGVYFDENVVVLEYFPSYKSPETFLKQVNHWLYTFLVQKIRVVGDERELKTCLSFRGNV